MPGDIYMAGLLKNVAGRAKTFDAADGFFAKAAAGTLPPFSWLLPRNGGAHPNDDHPCHDVALGELPCRKQGPVGLASQLSLPAWPRMAEAWGCPGPDSATACVA